MIAASALLGLDDAAALEPRLAGGKGASLARMWQAGFPVPAAVVVSADAYREFIARVDAFETRVHALDAHDAERLRMQCSELRAAIVAQLLPADLESSILEAAAPLLAKGGVSVRSSATLEDLAGAAFAGQHDTYLDVRDARAVVDAVRRCFASLWEDRAVRYRIERGFGVLQAEMAVVIQRMVASDVAGVAFSLDPVTGDASHIVVNAAYGLGETVVSGEGEVDHIVLEKATGAALTYVVGDKAHAIVGSQDGPQHVAVDEARRRAPSLAAGDLRELAALVVKVERHYGFPQDIEWALADGELHLLQSRPVTRFPARWTRDESAERFPNPVTPLTWDFTTRGFHESLAHSLALMGMPAFEGKWFERYGGYIYGNQTAVRLFTSGQQVAFDTIDDLAAMTPMLRDRYRWVQELPVAWARDLDRYLLELGRLAHRPLPDLDDGDLWRHVEEVDALGRGYFLPNIAISITQAVLHRMLFRICGLALGRERAPQVYDALTGFCETKTSLVNHDLFRLYRLAKQDDVLARQLSEVDRRELWTSGALQSNPRFLTALRRFIEDHGHRETDFDAYHPTWSGQPWVVLENLRLMLMRDDVPDPALRESDLRARQHTAERELVAAVPEPLRNFTAELVRLTRAYTGLDDLEHYQTTRLSVPFRAALVEVGRRLAARGALDEADDVFFLRRASLESRFTGNSSPTDADLLAEARVARASYLEQVRTPPAHVWGEAAIPAGEGALRGIPGSAGVAEGPVCRVFGVEDFASFRPGCVLVARTTNPAWTPLFYSAAAVIAESGGPLSHGAVTAREVGIPAVMAVHGALGMFADGDIVRVDGAQGTVSRV